MKLVFASLALVAAALVASYGLAARADKLAVCQNYTMVTGGHEAVCRDGSKPFVMREPQMVFVAAPEGGEKVRAVVGWR